MSVWELLLVLLIVPSFILVLKRTLTCHHSNTSFPRTPGNKKGLPSVAASVTGTYVVCLECGSEFPYDWERMQIVSAEEYYDRRRSITASS